MTYHIRPSDGARTKCEAEDGACPFLKDATEQIHFSTKEEADRVYHERMSKRNTSLKSGDVSATPIYTAEQKKKAKEAKAEFKEHVEFVRALAAWGTCEENQDIYLTVADELDEIVGKTDWRNPNSVKGTLHALTEKISDYEDKGNDYESSPNVLSQNRQYQNPWFECAGQVGYILDGKAELLAS